jgi:hypothetical protein
MAMPGSGNFGKLNRAVSVFMTSAEGKLAHPCMAMMAAGINNAPIQFEKRMINSWLFEEWVFYVFDWCDAKHIFPVIPVKTQFKDTRLNGS